MPLQDTNIVDFDPALLPIQPSDEVVNVSYGLRSFNLDSYEPGEIINIVLDTPYNVRDVRILIFNYCTLNGFGG